MLRDNPTTLAQQNGLGEAILAVSDAVLIDSATDRVTKHGFLSSHWATPSEHTSTENMLIAPTPSSVGEHDVDTVLHILLSRLAGDGVFEGMCNPPGGDWSGLSLRRSADTAELRWLSLPRVSGVGNKRPDHIFQFFGVTSQPVILAVESKETANSVERGVGPALTQYIENLIAFPASVERASVAVDWQASGQKLDPANFRFAAAVAFIPKSAAELTSVLAKSQADLVIACEFGDDSSRCAITLASSSPLGKAVVDYISQGEPKGYDISVTRAQ